VIIAREKQNVTAGSRHSGLIERRIKTISFEIISISKAQYLNVNVLLLLWLLVRIIMRYLPRFFELGRACQRWNISYLGPHSEFVTLSVNITSNFTLCLRKLSYNKYINILLEDRNKRSVIAVFGFIIF